MIVNEIGGWLILGSSLQILSIMVWAAWGSRGITTLWVGQTSMSLSPLHYQLLFFIGEATVAGKRVLCPSHQEEFNVISPLPIDIKLNHNETEDALMETRRSWGD